MDNETFQYYENTRYNFDRTPKKTLLLRWHSGSGSDQTNINLDLVEPFKIDTLCDIYLDNFTTHHTSSSSPSFDTPESSAFVLNINEFNIKSNIASNGGGSGVTPPTAAENMKDIFDNIVIPSDALSNNSTATITKSHKSKKMNYVGTINPTTLTKITGSITDLNGQAIFGTDKTDMFLAEFVFVARK